MQNNDVPLPVVGKISRLIDALRDYSLMSARAYWEDQFKDTYQAPCLASWDNFQWFELVQDWELIDFLISGTDKAQLLIRSLQSFLQLSGQSEIDEILAQVRIISRKN
jgi:hypothetical protein